jgi:hypothetical protein
VRSLRRLCSSDATRFLRWLPAAFGSAASRESVYFVPMTNRSRRSTTLPMSVSLSPYADAVSSTLPPASA